MSLHAPALTLRGRTIGPDAPVVTVPLTGRTCEELLAQAAQAAAAPVGLVEWRLDLFGGPQAPAGQQAPAGGQASAGRQAPAGVAGRASEGGPASAVGGLFDLAGLTASITEALGGVPLLATYRTRSQGGEGEDHPARYLELVRQLAHVPGIDLVDVELDHPLRTDALAELRAAGRRALLSHHDWTGQPDAATLTHLVATMRAAGADAVKLATTPADAVQAAELLRVQAELAREGVPLALIGMGEAGRLTRLAGPAAGAFLTFARLGAGSAPGQLDVALVAATLDALGLVGHAPSGRPTAR